ncbi:LCP family protein [Candidatus Daviesbacteria bacterium]|nr:LCP family protein [Candidatus Daviesbacteria bacterium]
MPAKSISTKGRSKHNNSWKDVQSKARIKKRSKIAIGILAFIIGLLIISWAVKFTQNLFQPWKESGIQKKYIWNGEFNINLLIRTSAVTLLSYNPKQEEIILIDIPEETFLEVPYGFGMWQLRAVYGLGQAQKDLGGNRLLVDTVTSFLAVPVDGFLDFSAFQPQKSPAEIVEMLRKDPIFGLNFLSNLKTDMTLWELFKLKLSLSAVRFDKVKQLDLSNLNVLSQEKLPDGTPVLTADTIRLDSVLPDLADPVIASEHKTIAVFNATDHPQLAGKWARLISNLGGNVIITANAKARLKSTQVTGEQSLTLKRMQQIFGSGGKINSLDEDLAFSRAQINLFVGEDLVNR